MKKSLRKPITALLLTLVLTISLLLGGCEQALIDNGMLREECESYLNAMLTGDFTAAHALTPEFSEAEHKTYFEANRQLLSGATSYELTQTGWNVNITDGITTNTAAYQIVTDNSKTLQFTLQTIEGVEGIANISLRDSGEFIESTKNIGSIDLVLKVVSLVMIAFSIWMLIDCIKRKISKKVLWIILILITISVGFTSGATSAYFHFSPSLITAFSSLEAVVPNETITLQLTIPLGALIYFFRRKKLGSFHPETPPVQQEEFAAPLSVSDYTVPKDSETSPVPSEEDQSNSDNS